MLLLDLLFEGLSTCLVKTDVVDHVLDQAKDVLILLLEGHLQGLVRVATVGVRGQRVRMR